MQPDGAADSIGETAGLSFCYSGNLRIENRHGLMMDTEMMQENGRAERDAALLILEAGSQTMGGQ